MTTGDCKTICGVGAGGLFFCCGAELSAVTTIKFIFRLDKVRAIDKFLNAKCASLFNLTGRLIQIVCPATDYRKDSMSNPLPAQPNEILTLNITVSCKLRNL